MMDENLEESLKKLVEGQRPPQNGMEVHFLKVIKGMNSPCTAEEKQWYSWWQSYSNTQKHDVVSVNPPMPTAEQAKRIAHYNLLVEQFKKTNEFNKMPVKRAVDLRIPLMQSKKSDYYKSAKIRANARYTDTRYKKAPLSPNQERMLKEKEAAILRAAENGPKPKPIPISEKELLKLKAKGPTNYTVDEGIGGTREDNKKMRNQLWGDIVSRGRK